MREIQKSLVVFVLDIHRRVLALNILLQWGMRCSSHNVICRYTHLTVQNGIQCET